MPDKMWQIDSFTGTEEEVKAKGNELGRHGWELVNAYPARGKSVHDKPHVTAWFKREIPQERIVVAPEVLDSLQSAGSGQNPRKPDGTNSVLFSPEGAKNLAASAASRAAKCAKTPSVGDTIIEEVQANIARTKDMTERVQAMASVLQDTSLTDEERIGRALDIANGCSIPEPPAYSEPEALDGNLRHPDLWGRPAPQLPEDIRDDR